jgi:hypothetical protein
MGWRAGTTIFYLRYTLLTVGGEAKTSFVDYYYKFVGPPLLSNITNMLPAGPKLTFQIFSS